tara:strand:+ start:1073 stop:1780 length:708 start_codon:yes stop_codon:yes gene_type:complete
MRYFISIDQAQNEITRDLKELALIYQSKSVQDMDVSKDKGYMTHELLNYQYSISHKNMGTDIWKFGLDNLDGDYLKEELFERLNTGGNPGNAYKHDEEYWSQFIHGGKFSYSYPERLEYNMDRIVAAATKNRDSRQLYIPIWWPQDTDSRKDGKRVPCSIGYHMAIRYDKLYMNYIMRSCDFYKHWAKDVVLAVAYGSKFMLEYNKQNKDNIKWGSFTHTIFSLHGFAKDMEGVF